MFGMEHLERIERLEIVVVARLDRLTSEIELLRKALAINLRGLGNMATAMETLTAAVQAEEGVEASAVAMLANLSAQIKNNLNDPAALEALADSIKNSSAGLAAAVAAAPGDPPVIVTPTPDPTTAPATVVSEAPMTVSPASPIAGTTPTPVPEETPEPAPEPAPSGAHAETNATATLS